MKTRQAEDSAMQIEQVTQPVGFGAAAEKRGAASTLPALAQGQAACSATSIGQPACKALSKVAALVSTMSI